MRPGLFYFVLTLGLAGLAGLAALSVLVWLFILYRLRRDARTIDDAVALKPVDLSGVIIAHVPPGQRTNQPEQEIGVAKDVVIRKLAAARRSVLVSITALAVLSAATVTYRIFGKPTGPVVVRQTSAGVDVAAIDALKALPGTWGWKYNALLACKENPHTITLSPDQSKLSIRFRTPLPAKDGPIAGYDYEVVRPGPSEVVLRLAAATDRRDVMGRPLEWSMHMEDKDTYFLKRSDVATQDTGMIMRCKG